jgi:hypothetical protein
VANSPPIHSFTHSLIHPYLIQPALLHAQLFIIYLTAIIKAGFLRHRRDTQAAKILWFSHPMVSMFFSSCTSHISHLTLLYLYFSIHHPPRLYCTLLQVMTSHSRIFFFARHFSLPSLTPPIPEDGENMSVDYIRPARNNHCHQTD